MDEGRKYFYFTRHGETVWNVENKICGATDIELTEKGRAQAAALGEFIKEKGIHIDEILCSPLIRAVDTAQAVAAPSGIPVRREPRLIEQCFGKYESTPRDGAQFAMDKRSFINSYEGGETMLHLCHRIYSLLDDLKQSDDGKIYLLVAHNGIARAVESYFRDMTNEEFAAFGLKNCELKKYYFD